MSRPFRVACVQTNSGRDLIANLDPLRSLVGGARAAGAELICLPENAVLIEPVVRLLIEKSPPESEHPALPVLQALAQETRAWLLIGSLQVKVGENKVANRSLLLDPAGAVRARYDKIHLFDVDLGNGERYQESATVVAGDRAVIAETPWGRLGLSVCYDLRFPQLYRRLAQAGAEFLAIPAAFTRTTGRAHWHILQRARAIETGCYVFAPAQCGTHAEGRETYGHSLIVDPWGEILADGGDGVGFIVADIDRTAVATARLRIPSLQHDRPFTCEPPGRAEAGSIEPERRGS